MRVAEATYHQATATPRTGRFVYLRSLIRGWWWWWGGGSTAGGAGAKVGSEFEWWCSRARPPRGCRAVVAP